MGSRSQTAIMVRLVALLLLVGHSCGLRQRRESSTFLLHQMPHHQFTPLKRFVNFGKPTLRPWQSVTPLPSRLAPTFQAAAVSSPVVAQQTVPSLRLPAELSSSSSRVKQRQQQARLVQLPRAKGQVEVNLLEGDRFNLVSNAVELPVRLHPEEELASRG